MRECVNQTFWLTYVLSDLENNNNKKEFGKKAFANEESFVFSASCPYREKQRLTLQQNITEIHLNSHTLDMCQRGNVTEEWLIMFPHTAVRFFTVSVKTPMTGLWSLMLYSMLLVYKSCLSFRGYSSSSSCCFSVFWCDPTEFSSCLSEGGSLGCTRHRILSVQAGFRFLLLNRWEQRKQHRNHL